MTRQRSNFNFVQKELQMRDSAQLLLTSRFPSPNNKRCSSTVDTNLCDCYFASAGRKEWKPLLSPSALFCNTVTKLRKSIIRINSPATVQADPLKTFSSPANWWPRLSRRTQETPQHMAAFQLAPLLVIDVTQQTLLDPPHTPSERSSKSLQLHLLCRRSWGLVRLVDHNFVTQCGVPQHLHQKYGRAAFADISDNFQDVSSQKYDKMIQSMHHSQLSALKQHWLWVTN